MPNHIGWGKFDSGSQKMAMENSAAGPKSYKAVQVDRTFQSHDLGRFLHPWA